MAYRYENERLKEKKIEKYPKYQEVSRRYD